MKKGDTVCPSKKAFNTAQQAIKFVNKANKGFKHLSKSKNKLWVYKCQVCGKFHTTSHPRGHNVGILS